VLKQQDQQKSQSMLLILADDKKRDFERTGTDDDETEVFALYMFDMAFA
jgi:hypothetical protein